MQLVQSCYIIKENKALPEDPEDPGDRHGEVIFNNKIGKGQGGIMSDAYVECLVKQKQAGIWKVLRVFLIVLAVLFLLATLFTLLGIVCFIPPSQTYEVYNPIACGNYEFRALPSRTIE